MQHSSQRRCGSSTQTSTLAVSKPRNAAHTQTMRGFIVLRAIRAQRLRVEPPGRQQGMGRLFACRSRSRRGVPYRVHGRAGPSPRRPAEWRVCRLVSPALPGRHVKLVADARESQARLDSRATKSRPGVMVLRKHVNVVVDRFVRDATLQSDVLVVRAASSLVRTHPAIFQVRASLLWSGQRFAWPGQWLDGFRRSVPGTFCRGTSNERPWWSSPTLNMHFCCCWWWWHSRDPS